MNCKELVYLLGDYLDGTMEEQLRQELSSHLEKCEPCLNFLKTYDKTRLLCRQITPDEIPEPVRDRLKSFILQKAGEHHRDIERYLERAAKERRERALDLLRAYRTNRLSPTMQALFKSHGDRCETCGAFLRTQNGGKEPSPVPPGVLEHIAEFLDALPPGEVPTLP